MFILPYTSIIKQDINKCHYRTDLVAVIWSSTSLDSNKVDTIFRKLSTNKFKLDEPHANNRWSIASIAMYT